MMKKKIIRHGIVAATTLALLLQPAVIALPNSVSGTVVAASTANKIAYLEGGGSLYIRDAKLLMQEKGLMLSYTVTIHNTSNKSVELLDYFFRLKGKGGKSYKATLVEADKDKKRIAAKSSVNLTYFAPVDPGTTLGDIALDIIKWDFNAANYERRIGTIKAPGDQVAGTAAFQPSVMLFGNTKLKGALKQFYVTQDQDGLYTTISFLVENVGHNSANLATMGLAIQTASNSVYDLTVPELAQMTVQPKERKIVTIQTKLPIALVGKVVQLVPYTKDETNQIKIPNGAYNLPALKGSSAVDIGKQRAIYIGGQSVETVVKNGKIGTEDAESSVNVDFVMTNTSSVSVGQPDLEFTIRTKDNTTYPLTYTKEEGGKLLPKLAKTISLSGTLPKGTDTSALQLVVKTASTEQQQSSVLGIYKFQLNRLEGNIGSSFTYKEKYQIELSSVERTPLEQEDVLVANLKIKNNSNDSISTPSTLKGYFMINGVRLTGDTQVLSLDQNISIAPNGSNNLTVYTKIPYSTSIGTVSFVLTEEEKDKPVRNLFQFSGQQLKTMPAYAATTGYAINNIGNQSNIKVNKTNIFKGENANYFYSEFEVTNMESRPSQLANIGAYIKDKAGNMSTLKVAEIKQRVSANGKILLTAWGKVGRTFDMTNYQLVFGQALGQPAQEGAEKESILINPVSYKIVKDQPVVADLKEDIKFSIYTLSLHNIQSILNVTGLYSVEGVKVSFDYDLKVDKSYDFVTDEHKLVFEFVDQEAAKTTYTKEVSLFSSAENQLSMKEGTGVPMEILFSDSSIQSKVRDYDKYVLNIYDVIDGAKVLIASKEIKWFEKIR